VSLGIVGALPVELQALTGHFTVSQTPIALSDTVWSICSGVGPQPARAAGKLLLKHGVTALVSWGCAGALDPRLTPGYLVLPTHVIGFDHVAIPVNATWHRRLYARLADQLDISTEALVTSEKVVTTPAAKHRLLAQFQAVAVDMESAALGLLAQEHQMPFLAIRAVADTATMTVPQLALQIFDPAGQLRLLTFLIGLLKSPQEGPALLRLARNFRAARATLTQVARCAGSTLLFSVATDNSLSKTVP
jgi:adenosylhomocysteine nucleosidase